MNEVIPADPDIWILGNLQSGKFANNKKHSTLPTATAKKKTLKADLCPSKRQWLHKLSSYSNPEKCFV